MANEPQSKFEEGNRPKIQDIIPRKDRKGSLLAKIMGPHVPAPLEKDTQSSFLRSLPFGRSGNKKTEKIIRLKKHAVSDVVLPIPEAVSLKKKTPDIPQKSVSQKALLREVRERVGVAAAAETVSRPPSRSSRRLMILAGSACVVVIVFLLSFIFVRATISLEPSFATLSLEGVRVEAADKVKETDVAGKKIPAVLLEVPGSVKREFSASAKERVSRKATGVVRVYNAFNASSQTLIAETRFEDPSGRVFRSKQRVVVPGAKIQNGKIVPSSVTVAVEAVQAGEEFNIGPSRFTIPGFAGTPKFNGFYAESSDAFTGGFVGEAFVVKQSDIDAASEEVTAALFTQLKEELERKIPSGLTAIQGAREVTVTALRKPNAGEARERFTVEADGKASAMLFRMDDLFSLLEELTLAPDSGKKISQEKSRFEFDRIVLSPETRVLSFDIQGSLAAFSVLIPEEFERVLSGKKRADAENILRADSRIRAFGIKFFPFWRNTIPADDTKIRIFVQE
ncbi:MAG: hypothetical protein Q7R73_05520 [bacterium]|nr:hypothetical protein [bacterium]